MCRNIRVLHHFEPPSTEDEMRAAAVQYVRKVSGLVKPLPADLAAFDRAVAEITKSTQALLGALPHRGQVRTREREKEKAKAKWSLREARMRGA